MIITEIPPDLSNVPKDCLKIVEVLLSYETKLSDGYAYYAPVDEDEPDNSTIILLVRIAKEIKTVNTQDYNNPDYTAGE